MTTTPLLVAEQVSKRFRLHHNRAFSLKARLLASVVPGLRSRVEDFWALRDVSLRVHRGEALGLVGRNGSGKSTLLKMFAGLHKPTTGRVLVRRGSTIAAVIELGVGFHHELTGRENVYLSASIYGLTRAAVDRIYDAVVDYSEIGQFIDEPIKNYSSGMMMRLAFALAVQLDPEVLLLDEIFAVGDEGFQQKCRRTMQQFIDNGRTMVFVSHSPALVRDMCNRVCVLNSGRLIFDGGVDEGLDLYHETAAAEPPSTSGSDHINGSAD